MWVKETHRDRFEVIHWETLYDIAAFERKKLARLRCNLENETIKLRQAFDLGREWIN
jgi:hypothetical protein